MAAAVVVTPAQPKVGQTLNIAGTGFLPNTVCTITILETGEQVELNSDVAGAVNSDDLADRAIGTLTSDATNVTADDTVTIGAVTYVFKASVTTTANEVKIGASAAATLANLKSAINLDGTAGVYGSATVVHPTVTAGVLTATTLALFAKTAGTGGNSLVSTEASSHLSFGASTLLGGAASTGISPLLFTPQTNTPITVVVSDGTSTVRTSVQVWN